MYFITNSHTNYNLVQNNFLYMLKKISSTLLISLTIFIYRANSQEIGNFTSVVPASQNASFHLPSTHKFQVLVQSGNTIPNGTGNVPAMLDFAGYVPVNGSSRQGILCVNSEFLPGGVMVLDIVYDSASSRWNVTGGANVSFSGVGGGTVTNCGGNITPWGTMVTCEENDLALDLNFDGYQDYGWNIEIDPVTKTVKDVDGDNNPDKLWAMGRMKHENVAFLSDSVTVYQGEDNSSSGILFKFIATQKANLSNGTLFALSVDGNTGTWISIPNTSKAERNNAISNADFSGATLFNRIEDVEVGPDGKIYFVSTTQGRVFRFKDDGATVSEFETWVFGGDYTVNTPEGPKTVTFGSPDNLAFDNQGNLWVCQDGGGANGNYIWMIEPSHTPTNPKVHLFARTPAGSEPTGIFFTPDGKFMIVNIQHPDGGNNVMQPDITGNNFKFNADATLIIAREEIWGNSQTSIPNQDLQFGDLALKNLYPNPADDLLTFVLYSATIENKVQLEFFDLQGKLIKTSTVQLVSGDNLFTLPVSDLTAGIYILKIKAKQHTIEGHIIKK